MDVAAADRDRELGLPHPARPDVVDQDRPVRNQPSTGATTTLQMRKVESAILLNHRRYQVLTGLHPHASTPSCKEIESIKATWPTPTLGLCYARSIAPDVVRDSSYGSCEVDDADTENAVDTRRHLKSRCDVPCVLLG